MRVGKLTATRLTMAAVLTICLIGLVVWLVQRTGRPSRPQDEAVARGPRPYKDQQVAFDNVRAHVRLGGTLSIPDGTGPFPAVLLIAASGPMDRDENAGGHLVFVVLADHLLRRGIAVLRYDKRGVGASTGDFDKAGFDDLVGDAAAAVRYLRARPEVDPHRVGIIGHSEGGSIGPAVAATDPEVAFLVAMAGSGLSGEYRITEIQVYLQRENGATPEQQQSLRALCHGIFRIVEKSPDDAVANRQSAALIDEAVAARRLTTEQVKPLRELLTPKFVREELTDNPIEYLKQVHVPVLAIVGTLDHVVPAGPYEDVMRPVLATIPGSRLQVIPNLNHLMQTARTGSFSESASLSETISPVALRTIGDWVTQQASVRTRSYHQCAGLSAGFLPV